MRQLDGVLPPSRTLTLPAALVPARFGGHSRDLTATAPSLVAEVLSPSSVSNDLRDKAVDYLRLPSLSAYLVLAQDEAKAWAWVRSATGFASSPSELVGHDAIIEITSLGINPPLSEIYFDIATS
jgi:Uma2 family endonuclease